MDTTSDGQVIKQVRRKLLVMLKVVYPASLSADVLFRALLGAFPQMEWEYLRKDLSYLLEKGYLTRQAGSATDQAGEGDWRGCDYRLSAAGVELVDRCTVDAALEA